LAALYLAGQGLGAWRKDGNGSSSLNVTGSITDKPLRIIGSRSHGSEDLQAWLEELDRPYSMITAGSSLKFCRVAEGRADIYPRFGPTSQWDTAAGQCVVEIAGGRVM